jgi:hypothetical protein
MFANNRTPYPRLDTATKNVILDLCIDAKSGAAWLAVRPENLAPAVDWVRVLVINPRARLEHFVFVESVLGTASLPRTTWAKARKPADVPDRVRELVETGPRAFTGDELATLLLDVNALVAFATLVEQQMPDWYLDALADDGARYATMVAVTFGENELVAEVESKEATELREELFAGARQMGPKSNEPEYEGPVTWEVRLPADTQRRIAKIAFGDPSREFTLKLHRVREGRADVEMSPVPFKSDVTLLATFRTGDERVFVIERPYETKLPGADPDEFRRSTRSPACDPLPNAAYPESPKD